MERKVEGYRIESGTKRPRVWREKSIAVSRRTQPSRTLSLSLCHFPPPPLSFALSFSFFIPTIVSTFGVELKTHAPTRPRCRELRPSLNLVHPSDDEFPFLTFSSRGIFSSGFSVENTCQGGHETNEEDFIRSKKCWIFLFSLSISLSLSLFSHTHTVLLISIRIRSVINKMNNFPFPLNSYSSILF